MPRLKNDRLVIHHSFYEIEWKKISMLIPELHSTISYIRLSCFDVPLQSSLDNVSSLLPPSCRVQFCDENLSLTLRHPPFTP
jgi:hypothetical protein